MIPSVTELGTFGLLYTAPFFPQVTAGCDHVLIPKALSALANGKELILTYHSCNWRNTEMAQLSATCPSNLMVLKSPDIVVGPRS
jgi:hypothetical protein